MKTTKIFNNGFTIIANDNENNTLQTTGSVLAQQIVGDSISSSIFSGLSTDPIINRNLVPIDGGTETNILNEFELKSKKIYANINTFYRPETYYTLATSAIIRQDDSLSLGPNQFSIKRAQGQFYLTGNASYSGSSAKIYRINSDGVRDTTFNPGGGLTTGTSNRGNELAVQNDGKVIVVGIFTSFSGSTANRIVRINTDGTLDNTFNTGTGFNSTANRVLVQNDGKIIVGGEFTTYSGSTANRLVRLNADGTLDTSFNVGLGPSSTVNAIGIQSDNKILIGGGFPNYSGSLVSGFTRVNTDGTLDTTFNIGTSLRVPTSTTTSGNVFSIAVQADDKVLIGGTFTFYSGSSQNRIARLNYSGSIDGSFNTGNGITSALYNSSGEENRLQVNNITLYNDKIFLVGNFANYSGSLCSEIVKLNNDGTVDTSFDVGLGLLPFKYETLLDFSKPGKSLAVDETNGNVWVTYTGIRWYNGAPMTGFLNSKGKLLNAKFKIISRIYNQDIRSFPTVYQYIDASPSVASPPGSLVGFFHIYPDEKVLFLGSFRMDTGVPSGYITTGSIRFNTTNNLKTLTYDDTFNSGVGFNGRVSRYSLVEENGDILALGGTFSGFTTYSGSTVNRIVRIKNDGTIDPTFNTGDGFNNNASQVIKIEDKYIIVGNFTTYSGSTVNGIVRINNDGTIDNTFNTGTGLSSSANFIIPTDNNTKFYIGGSGLKQYSGSVVSSIIRINNDGTLDTSFNAGTGITGSGTVSFSSMHIQSDGKLIINKTSNEYSGSSWNRTIIRVNTDGTLDTSYDPGFNMSTDSRTTTLDNKDNLYMLVAEGRATLVINGKKTLGQFKVIDKNGNMPDKYTFCTPGLLDSSGVGQFKIYKNQLIQTADVSKVNGILGYETIGSLYKLIDAVPITNEPFYSTNAKVKLFKDSSYIVNIKGTGITQGDRKPIIFNSSFVVDNLTINNLSTTIEGSYNEYTVNIELDDREDLEGELILIFDNIELIDFISLQIDLTETPKIRT